MNLQQLRTRVLFKRQALSQQQRIKMAEKVAAVLFNTPFYTQAKNIGCYYSVKEELATQLIIQGILAEGKRCYLPRLIPHQTGVMEFVNYQEEDLLLPNQFAIPEPCIPERQVQAVTALDLVLAPLVAVDQQGNRLGMGAGYYDRMMQNKKEKPFYCGLAYSCQQITEIIAKPWDVPLDAVVTEQGVVVFIKKILSNA